MNTMDRKPPTQPCLRKMFQFCADCAFKQNQTQTLATNETGCRLFDNTHHTLVQDRFYRLDLRMKCSLKSLFLVQCLLCFFRCSFWSGYILTSNHSSVHQVAAVKSRRKKSLETSIKSIMEQSIWHIPFQTCHRHFSGILICREDAYKSLDSHWTLAK